MREGDVVAANGADTDIAEHKRDVLQNVSFSIKKSDFVAVIPELPVVANLPC